MRKRAKAAKSRQNLQNNGLGGLGLDSYGWLKVGSGGLGLVCGAIAGCLDAGRGQTITPARDPKQ